MDAAFEHPCHAFHESFLGGKRSGSFTLSTQGLHFVLGDVTGFFPFANLKINVGGANNRLIFISHPSRPDLVLYTSDLTLLKNSILQSHPECYSQLIQARQQRRSSWIFIAIVGLLLLLLPILFLFQLDRASGVIAKAIPIQWETTLGKGVAAQYSLSHTLMEKDLSTRLLKPLTAPLISALPNTPYTYDLTIVNDPSLNAFALPGGFLTIHSGLILKAESAEELLGVIAHEISHVEERHGVRSIIKNSSIYLLASTLLGDIQGILATVASAAPMLLTQQYSRGFESDADEKAVKLLRKAKVDPNGLPLFFEKMILEEKKTLDKITNEDARAAYKKIGTLLSTHPSSEERMQRLRSLTKDEIGEHLHLEAEFFQLQSAVKKFVAESPDTASLAKEIDSTTTTNTSSTSNTTTHSSQQGDSQ
jgi:beta-barrel assembly-enhancing protease